MNHGQVLRLLKREEKCLKQIQQIWYNFYEIPKLLSPNEESGLLDRSPLSDRG